MTAWKPIETALEEGPILVKGGKIKWENYYEESYEIALVYKEDQDYIMINNHSHYPVWIENPTEWAEIPE